MMKNAEILEGINYCRGVIDAVIMLDSNTRGAMECCVETLEAIEQALKENHDGRAHP